eukprot:jgi/Undpi1/2373/HiC_scaffold_13.g05756.m3
MRVECVLLGLVALSSLHVSSGASCANGLEGVQQNDICCAAECGTCGGVGCSQRPGGQDLCCTTLIEISGMRCSDTKAAPCIIDDEEEEKDKEEEGPLPTRSPESTSPTTSEQPTDTNSTPPTGGGGSGTEYQVSPDGTPMSLTEALEKAGAGDTISLADGLYREPIVTMHAGEEGNPLVIKGTREAVISAFSGDRLLMWDQKVVDIRHSWITLEGFTINGHLNGLDKEEDYVDKCIFVEGQEAPTDVAFGGETVKSSLIGFHVSGMHIHNCGMECIRMRNFVTNSVIANNVIEDCGIYDFQYQFDGKIGEAIYIGTSSNQWADGVGTRVTNGPDECNYNLVTGNELIPRGNECVDVKEGASFNVVEYNECQEQLDDESGCYDSRGNENTFRYNSGSNCDGAGVRLGGHVIDGFTYGVNNNVYGNNFDNNGVGSIKSMVHPQGIICENTCAGDCDVQEKGDDDEIDASWMADCPEVPGVPFIDP